MSVAVTLFITYKKNYYTRQCLSRGIKLMRENDKDLSNARDRITADELTQPAAGAAAAKAAAILLQAAEFGALCRQKLQTEISR